ncbi:MAG: HAD-IA family hydrolase, partial [Aquihabitans sp.]
RLVLDAAGLLDTFDVLVDGVKARDLGLAGKPDPALFLEAASRLDVAPGRTAVVEDARSGVAAGRAGGFVAVIGVDRTGSPDQLWDAGADVVVDDLDELSVHKHSDGCCSLRTGGTT